MIANIATDIAIIVATENYAFVSLANILYYRFEALRSQTYTVDNGFILGQFEYSRLGVALLWARGDRSNLHKAETERREWAENLAIAVVAGGDAYRIAEMNAEDLSLQTLILNGINLVHKPLCQRHFVGNTEHPNRERMGSLGSEKAGYEV